MKSIVVMTYYQLMHSIALALTFEEKPNLFFSVNYLNIDDEFIGRIKKTNIFNDVITLDFRAFSSPFHDEMKLTENMTSEDIDSIGNRIFEKYLEPYFDSRFSVADKTDDIFVYNDFQYYYYYIDKHFDNIIGVEDGYKSLKQQISIHKFKGNHALVKPFIDKYYPEPLYKGKNIKKIISSCDANNLDDYYKEKVEVLDFKNIISKNQEKYKRVLAIIFQCDEIIRKEPITLFIGQPLDRARYCTQLEYYLWVRKTIHQEHVNGRHVFIKPHPADLLDYSVLSNDNITVLEKTFPIELLNYQNVKIDKAITFGSTSIETLDCVDKKIIVYDSRVKSVSHKQISKYIKNEVKNETCNITYYITVDKLSPIYYVNIYGYLLENNNFTTEVIVLIDKKLGQEAINYYEQKHLNERIGEYFQILSNSISKGLYEFEIKRLNKDLLKESNNTIDFIFVDNVDDEINIYNEIISSNKICDYFALIDASNLSFSVVKTVTSIINKTVAKVILSNNHIMLSDRKIPLGYGNIGMAYLGFLENRIWHRTLIDKYDKLTEEILECYLCENNKAIVQRSTLDLVRTKQKIYDMPYDNNSIFIDRIVNISKQKIEESLLADKIALMIIEQINFATINMRPIDNVFLINQLKENVKMGILVQSLMKIVLSQKENQRIENTRKLNRNAEIYKYCAPLINDMIIRGKMFREKRRIIKKRRFQKYKRKLINRTKRFLSRINMLNIHF